jgi:hypothetical protein
MNCELQSKCKVVVMSSFKVLCMHLVGVSDENHDKPQDSRFPGRNLIPGPPDYESGVIITLTPACEPN